VDWGEGAEEAEGDGEGEDIDEEVADCYSRADVVEGIEEREGRSVRKDGEVCGVPGWPGGRMLVTVVCTEMEGEKR
jgi:hypothetical protein